MDGIRLQEESIVQEDLHRQSVMGAEDASGIWGRARTSTFLLTLRLEWALTILLTVARG